MTISALTRLYQARNLLYIGGKPRTYGRVQNGKNLHGPLHKWADYGERRAIYDYPPPYELYRNLLHHHSEGRCIMLTAHYKIINQWNREEIIEREEDFARVDALEDFLAYNRAYIISLSFTGSFEKEQD